MVTDSIYIYMYDSQLLLDPQPENGCLLLISDDQSAYGTRSVPGSVGSTLGVMVADWWQYQVWSLYQGSIINRGCYATWPLCLNKPQNSTKPCAGVLQH